MSNTEDLIYENLAYPDRVHPDILSEFYHYCKKI